MSDESQTPKVAATEAASPSSPPQPQPLSKRKTKATKIAPSFPQKRRGRPPGRPNTTVKESDFEDNAAVQRWNAARADTPIPAVAINIRDALPESFLTRDAQREIYKQPSREFIYFVQGWITSRQIASQRPSYVNGLLIHSRGWDSPTSCDQCAEKRGKNALGPFLTCRILRGSFHNSCSNCKWFDTTSSCSLYTGPKPNRKRKAKSLAAAETPIEDEAQSAPQNGTAEPISEQQTTDIAPDVVEEEMTSTSAETAVLELARQNGDSPDAEDSNDALAPDSDQES